MAQSIRMTKQRFAYEKGWDASKRSTTYDLDKAEAQFDRRYGSDFDPGSYFAAGWADYAADYEKYRNLPEQYRGNH